MTDLERDKVRMETLEEVARELSAKFRETPMRFRFGFCNDRKTAFFEAAQLVYDKALAISRGRA